LCLRIWWYWYVYNFQKIVLCTTASPRCQFFLLFFFISAFLVNKKLYINAKMLVIDNQTPFPCILALPKSTITSCSKCHSTLMVFQLLSLRPQIAYQRKWDYQDRLIISIYIYYFLKRFKTTLSCRSYH